MSKNFKLNEGSTSNPIFKEIAIKILKAYSNLFIFSRYLSDKKYFLIKSEKEIDEFLENRNPKECVTLFKNKFEIIYQGIINDKSIAQINNLISQKEKIDWVVIGKEDNGNQWSSWINNLKDFTEVIKDELNNQVVIIKDQNWFEEEETIHAYIPDNDGIIRLGSY